MNFHSKKETRGCPILNFALFAKFRVGILTFGFLAAGLLLSCGPPRSDRIVIGTKTSPNN